MFGKINEIKQQMQEVQAELDRLQLTTEKSGVKVVITANKDIQSIEISEDLFATGDRKKIEDLLLEALNQSVKDAESVSKAKMMEVTKGMLPPGLPGM